MLVNSYLDSDLKVHSTTPPMLNGLAESQILLELMLGQITSYCPIISETTIIKNLTSTQSVWNIIHAHFGFQITFLDFANFVKDTLLRASDLSHYGEVTTAVDTKIMSMLITIINQLAVEPHIRPLHNLTAQPGPVANNEHFLCECIYFP